MWEASILGDIARSCTQAICYLIVKKNNPWTKKKKEETQLDDPGCSRCNLSKGVYMSHNIMTPFLLLNSSYLELFRSEGLYGSNTEVGV